MKLKFTKMHGLGNDFIVLNGINQKIKLESNEIVRLANRHSGIGFDQCLIIEPSTNPSIDFNYRIFNADGHEVGQCGNGARCLALFAKYHGLTNKTQLKIATKTTEMTLYINTDNSVTVDMGSPKLSPQAIPFIADAQQDEYSLELAQGNTINIHAINVGNPHAVTLVSDIINAPVETIGAQISEHMRFPEQTNAGFMHILNPEQIQLRVYERGAGETQACGSGAVAAAAIGRLYHGLESQIRVSLLGGDLIVDWPDLKNSIRLTGPATFVYEGDVYDYGNGSEFPII